MRTVWYLNFVSPVLLSSIDGELAESFIETVIRANEPPLFPASEFRVVRIPAHVRTEVYDFSLQYLIVDCRRNDELAQQLLSLEHAIFADTEAVPALYRSESFWATAFDYPISLDDMAPDQSLPEEECEDEFPELVEIGYVDVSTSEPMLLSTYGGMQKSELMQKAMRHYQLYRSAVQSSGIQLQMDIRAVEEEIEPDEGEFDSEHDLH
jgi:hypothetical protein